MPARRKRQTQRAVVAKVLGTRKWVSLKDFRGAGGTDSSLSARIRDMRKQSHGKRVIECKRFPDAIYRYRLVK
jgi:hypothetical protein